MFKNETLGVTMTFLEFGDTELNLKIESDTFLTGIN